MSFELHSRLRIETPVLRQVGVKLAKVDGVNLAQGLCLMPAPQLVKDQAYAAMQSGKNIYTHAQGVIELREALAKRLQNFNGIAHASADNIIVTPGSTGAFEAVCQSFIEPGDEVISFIPFYPYHRTCLERNGAVQRHVQLHAPDWTFNIEDLARACSAKTKMLLLITPNNPTGKVFSETELRAIAHFCIQRNILCVTDEVYEYMTYDGHRHISIASLPGMAERTITMSSYSKTFAITGWRIGFLLCPPALTDTLRFAADSLFVCAASPLQFGVAAGVASFDERYYETLKQEYSRKREILLDGLQGAGLTVNKPQGAYFILASTSDRFPGKTSEEVVDIMIERAHVGAVPASDFLGPSSKGDPSRSNFLRFSFGVPDEMLEKAAARLKNL